MAIEEPQYRVLVSEDEMEIREYEPFIVAETRIEAPMEEAGNRAFRILANYIFGGNSGQKKISMTAPVSVQAESEGTHVVTFSMPSGFTMESLPKPEDSKVTLRPVPKKKMAAYRYSGTWSIERFEERKKRLTAWIQAKNLKITGSAIFARYNAPWTPWFLRRNEVLIPLEE